MSDDGSDDAEDEPSEVHPSQAGNRISVTLNGDLEADCARLLTSYPRDRLIELANAVLDSAEADDRPSAEPVKLSASHRMILDALADGTPLSARQIMTVSLNYRERITELRRAGYEIELIREGRDTYYKLVRKPG